MQLENRHDLLKQEKGACVSTPEQNCLHSERPECTKHDKARLRTSTAMDFTQAVCFVVRNSFAFCFASALITDGRLRLGTLRMFIQP